MHQPEDTARVDYPHGRGYGHDYMRGGEVFGGYGYAEREEYSKPRGDTPPYQQRAQGDHSPADNRS
ncbi:MAG TPA: hypothetical protein VG818_04630 [Gemmatimonadaceae bacterium]|jgi:hypothetical protein|nr:hypothetical protein [Gemmatimonadaceae bacterium]